MLSTYSPRLRRYVYHFALPPPSVFKVRDDRVDVVFRRVVFQLDGVAGRPVTNVRKVVSPRPDPTLGDARRS